MKRIPTKVHGFLDYLTGGTLIFLPALFSLDRGGLAVQIPLALGIATVAYSLFTRYEWGLFKLLPMPGHLTLDLANGALLALSPWIFDFADEVWRPHVFIGLFELVVTAMSRAQPGPAFAAAHVPARDRPTHAH